MDARAAEKGLKLLSKDEARTLAKQEYREALYLKNVEAIAEACRKVRGDTRREAIAVDDEKQRFAQPYE